MASTEAEKDESLNRDLWSAPYTVLLSRLEYEGSRDNPYCNGKVFNRQLRENKKQPEQIDPLRLSSVNLLSMIKY